MTRHTRISTLFPSRRSSDLTSTQPEAGACQTSGSASGGSLQATTDSAAISSAGFARKRELGREIIKRSEEHTSELQSQSNLVCRLLLEKKKIRYTDTPLMYS